MSQWTLAFISNDTTEKLKCIKTTMQIAETIMLLTTNVLIHLVALVLSGGEITRLETVCAQDVAGALWTTWYNHTGLVYVWALSMLLFIICTSVSRWLTWWIQASRSANLHLSKIASETASVVVSQSEIDGMSNVFSEKLTNASARNSLPKSGLSGGFKSYIGPRASRLAKFRELRSRKLTSSGDTPETPGSTVSPETEDTSQTSPIS